MNFRRQTNKFQFEEAVFSEGAQGKSVKFIMKWYYY